MGTALPALGQGGEKAAPPGEDAPAAQRDAGGLVAWWKQKSLCDELGLTAAQRQRLVAGLESLQTRFQLAQTRLNEARARQTVMMLDPAIDAAALVAFNRDEVVAPSDQMQAFNFEARMLVRGELAKPQLEAIARSHPRFFTARWFQRSAVPVHEGKVILQEE